MMFIKNGNLVKMKKIRVIPNWKQTIRYAWSLRFSILSGLCSAGEVIVTYYPDKLPRGAMAGLAGTFALLGTISSLIPQRNMTDDC